MLITVAEFPAVARSGMTGASARITQSSARWT